MIIKRYLFVIAGIVIMFAGCQTSPPPIIENDSALSGVPQGINDLYNDFGVEGFFVGVGFAKDKYQREKLALADISRQLSNIIQNTYVNWYNHYTGKRYVHSITLSGSPSSSALSSWLKENSISAEREYSEGEWYAVAYEIRLRYPNLIMPVTTTPLFTIEEAVQNAARNVSDRLPSGSKIAITNISAADPDDSVFAIEELSTELVKISKEGEKEYTIVDRRSLDAIRAEHKFQLSGDVSDDTIVLIGHFLGADVVVTGSITGMNEFRRLRVKVLDVKTARLLIQTNLKY
jgi:hypothetical protein